MGIGWVRAAVGGNVVYGVWPTRSVAVACVGGDHEGLGSKTLEQTPCTKGGVGTARRGVRTLGACPAEAVLERCLNALSLSCRQFVLPFLQFVYKNGRGARGAMPQSFSAARTRGSVSPLHVPTPPRSRC